MNDEYLAQFFTSKWVQPELRYVSQQYDDLGHWIIRNVPMNRERTVALRSLLKSKDEIMRAYLAEREKQ